METTHPHWAHSEYVGTQNQDWYGQATYVWVSDLLAGTNFGVYTAGTTRRYVATEIVKTRFGYKVYVQGRKKPLKFGRKVALRLD